MPAAAPTYNMYSNLVDVSTTQQYMKGVFENVKKRNIILRLLDERGNIKKEASGKFFERNLRVGQNSVAYRTADLAPRSFARLQKNVTCAVPYALKEVTGVLGEADVMFNSGKEALISLRQRMFADMSQDFKISLAGDLLASNGGSNSTFGIAAAASSPVPFFGLPTIFGYGSSALAYNATTQTVGSAVAAGDVEVAPNATYCGVSTHPTNAISGVDNRLNEATSPIIVNYTSTGFGSTTTWAANAIKILNYSIDRASRGTDADDVPDIGLVTRTMFTDLKNNLVQYYKIELQSSQSGPNAGLYKENKVPFGSIDVYWDESMPSGVFYVLNTKKMEFVTFPQKKMLLDDTFDDNGDEMFNVRSQYDIAQGGHLAVAQLAGQLWANPKYQLAGYSFA